MYKSWKLGMMKCLSSYDPRGRSCLVGLDLLKGRSISAKQGKLGLVAAAGSSVYWP